MKAKIEVYKDLREKAVFMYLTNNVTAKEIAQKFGISERAMGGWLKEVRKIASSPELKEQYLKRLNNLNYQTQIAQIFQKARDENRTINSEELKAINDLHKMQEKNK